MRTSVTTPIVGMARVCNRPLMVKGIKLQFDILELCGIICALCPQEDSRNIIRACAPYTVVAARWEVDCPVAEGPDLPTAHRMDAQFSVAR